MESESILSPASGAPTRKDLLRAFKAGLMAAVLAAAATLLMTNQYTATATLLPQVQSRGNGLGAGLAMLGLGGGGGLEALGDQQGLREMSILQSRWMATQLLSSRFTFSYKTWYFGSPKPVDGTLYAFLEAKDTDQAVKILDKWIDPSRDLKSGLITLKVQAPSPELAQQISARALGLLDEFLQRETRAEGAQRAKFYQDRLADVQGQASQAEQKLAQFAGRNVNYFSSPSPDVRLEGARLEADLQGKRQLVASMNMSVQQAMVDENNDIPVLSVLDQPVAPSQKSGPHRSLIVLAVLVAVTAGMWLKRHWRWLAGRIDGLESFSGSWTADDGRA